MATPRRGNCFERCDGNCLERRDGNCALATILKPPSHLEHCDSNCLERRDGNCALANRRRRGGKPRAQAGISGRPTAANYVD